MNLSWTKQRKKLSRKLTRRNIFCHGRAAGRSCSRWASILIAKSAISATGNMKLSPPADHRGSMVSIIHAGTASPLALAGDRTWIFFNSSSSEAIFKLPPCCMTPSMLPFSFMYMRIITGILGKSSMAGMPSFTTACLRDLNRLINKARGRPLGGFRILILCLEPFNP